MAEWVILLSLLAPFCDSSLNAGGKRARCIFVDAGLWPYPVSFDQGSRCDPGHAWPYPSSTRCCWKKRSISRLASGPRGSV